MITEDVTVIEPMDTPLLDMPTKEEMAQWHAKVREFDRANKGFFDEMYKLGWENASVDAKWFRFTHKTLGEGILEAKVYPATPLAAGEAVWQFAQEHAKDRLGDEVLKVFDIFR